MEPRKSPWDEDPEGFAKNLAKATEVRIAEWEHHYGPIVKAVADATGLSCSEAILYLSLTELCVIRSAYQQMVQLGVDNKPKLDGMLEIAERLMDDIKEEDHWKEGFSRDGRDD